MKVSISLNKLMIIKSILLGFFLLNFQQMVESLLQDAVMIQYLFMILKQINQHST